MKCQKCGQEMRFGQETYGTDANGDSIYKDFAYCDNCGTKVEIQQAQQFQQINNGFHSVGIQNINNTPKKKKHGCLWYILIFFLVCALFSQCNKSDEDSDNKSDNDASVSSEITAAPKAKNENKKVHSTLFLVRMKSHHLLLYSIEAWGFLDSVKKLFFSNV